MITAALKRLSKNTIGFSVGTILTQAIGFFLIPIYTNYLSPSDYGILSIASVISAILTILVFLGMRSAITRFYFDYPNAKDLKEYLSTITISILATSFSLTFLAWIFGNSFFSILFPEVPFYPYLILVFLTVFFNIPLTIAFILLQVREQSFHYSFINVMKFLLTTSAIVIFVVIYHKGALGSLFGQCVAAAILFFVGIALLKKDIGFVFISGKLKDSLTFGIYLIPHELASWTTNLIDRIFLNYYTSLSVVGIYSLGYQFASILTVITTMMNYAWVPFFISSFQESGDQIKPIIAQLTRYYVMFLMLCALGISLFSREIIICIANPDYYSAIPIVPVVILAFIFDGLYYMVVTQLFIVKKTVFITLSTLTAAALNITFNFILIPQYGMFGAAASTVISFGFSFILVFYFSHQLFPIKYDYTRLAAPIILAIFIFLVSLGIPQDCNLIISVCLKCVLMALYAGCLISFGLLSKNELIEIKREFLA